jgi:type I restriction enzyme S subunit
MPLKFRWETGFKETEIGEIPKDWEVRRLGEVVYIKQGKNISTLKLKDWGYHVFGANGSIGYTDTYHYEEPQVLIACRGSTCGIINRSFPKSFVNNNAMALLLKSIDKNFLYFSMQLNFISGRIDETITGTGQPQITKETLEPFLIIFPPLPEQSRIATVLSLFDDLIENKKRENEILEKTAMAIFKNWFVDFEPFKDEEFVYNEELGRGIPKGWEVKKIGDVIKFIYGEGLPERNRKEGIYPVVGSSGIVGFHSEYIAEPPTIIIGRKGNAGSVQLFLENSYPIDTVFYSSKHTPPEVIFYIYHLLKIISLEDMALTDTAVPGLNIHMLNSLIIFIPPSPILQSFHSLVEPLFQKIILNQKQIMTLRKIRDTLLPLLVFGKLRAEEI